MADLMLVNVPAGRSMREALEELRDHCEAERDYCDQNGRSTRAEAYERLRIAFDEKLTEMVEPHASAQP